MKIFKLLILIFLFTNCNEEKKYRISHTYDINGLQTPSLRFSWKMNSSHNKAQSAHQITLFTKGLNGKDSDVIIWDSGKTKNSNQLNIPYGGPALKGGLPYYSKVRIWDSNDTPSEWSEPKQLIASLNYPQDWKGKWITYDYSPTTPLPVFRKAFTTKPDKEINYARFNIAAPGFYEAYINGTKIGKNVLDPAQTNYEDYMFYSSYDIPKEQLNSINILGVMLGNGWYNQNVVWNKSMIYGQPLFLAQLDIHYTDGSKETIKSDTSWKWQKGPITYTNIYTGEFYDARKEVNDWFKTDSDFGNWKKATIAEKEPTKIVEQFAEPIKVMDSIVPENIVPQ